MLVYPFGLPFFSRFSGHSRALRDTEGHKKPASLLSVCDFVRDVERLQVACEASALPLSQAGYSGCRRILDRYLLNTQPFSTPPSLCAMITLFDALGDVRSNSPKMGFESPAIETQSLANWPSFFNKFTPRYLARTLTRLLQFLSSKQPEVQSSACGLLCRDSAKL